MYRHIYSKKVQNDHLGSSCDQCYIHNSVVKNHVIKRSRPRFIKLFSCSAELSIKKSFITLGPGVLCKNKDADHYCRADHHLCFHYQDSTPLLFK